MLSLSVGRVLVSIAIHPQTLARAGLGARGLGQEAGRARSPLLHPWTSYGGKLQTFDRLTTLLNAAMAHDDVDYWASESASRVSQFTCDRAVGRHPAT